VVYAAVALDDAQKAALQSKLEKITGKTIRMEVKIDPSVIAGLRVEVDGELLDGTVQGRMSGISRKLEEIV
jgi:F-type H+-transporting ATPase subunit delta